MHTLSLHDALPISNAWVIKKPTPSEKEGLNNAFTKANESLEQLLNKEWLIAMNDLHTK